jgi:hypothetical protein
MICTSCLCSVSELSLAISLQVFLAKDIAADCKDSQYELWLRISKDEYMEYAVVECFHSIQYILTSILDSEGRLWYFLIIFPSFFQNSTL